MFDGIRGEGAEPRRGRGALRAVRNARLRAASHGNPPESLEDAGAGTLDWRYT